LRRALGLRRLMSRSADNLVVVQGVPEGRPLLWDLQRNFHALDFRGPKVGAAVSTGRRPTLG